MPRFGSTLSIQALTHHVRAQMRRLNGPSGARTCLGCGQSVRASEHGVRVAGGLCHVECALYRRRTA